MPTSREAAEIFGTFLECAAHTILYTRNIYPAGPPQHSKLERHDAADARGMRILMAQIRLVGSARVDSRFGECGFDLEWACLSCLPRHTLVWQAVPARRSVGVRAQSGHYQRGSACSGQP